MKKNTSLLFLAVFSAAGFLLIRCGSDTGTIEKPTDNDKYATNDNPATLCIANPSWFPHSQTPAPQEGEGSPFDVSSTTNQIFHQWSWNKFLWLTKPDPNGVPLFLNSKDIQQVTTYMNPVPAPSGTLLVLQDFNQAGSTSPVLKTNAGYGGASETVYYSIHMNNTMYQSGVEFAKELFSKKLPGTNQATFPVGSFELKVAWVPVTAIPQEKRSLYFITKASLSKDSGKTFTNTDVALIGMHVVGVVENHPEFIWATFEHDDLAPDYDWKSNSANASEQMLLFKRGSTTGIDGIRFNPATQLGYTPFQVFDLYKYGVPKNQGGGFMTTSQQEPENFANVDGINSCVHSKLNDVWKNYFYNGSIWLDMDGKTHEEQAQLINSLGSSIGSVTPGSSARGSMNCANVTMESFTQTFQSDIKDISVNNLANCFSCHRGKSFQGGNASPIYLSHTFQDYLNRVNGVSVKTVEDLKTQDEKKTLMMMQKK